MDSSPAPADVSRKTWTDRLQAFFEVLLISGIVSSFVAAIPLFGFSGGRAESTLQDARIVSIYLIVESAVTFLLLALLMKAHGEKIASLGLSWDNLRRNILLGIALVPVLFFINAVVAVIFKLYLPQYFVDVNPLTQIIKTPQQLALFIFSALIAGGIKEELQRAFIINRFRNFLGGAWAGLIIWSVVFGAFHYVQKEQGMVIATLMGFLFGLLYLLSGSLVGPIVAHALYDTIALLAYWFISQYFK